MVAYALALQRLCGNLRIMLVLIHLPYSAIVGSMTPCCCSVYVCTACDCESNSLQPLSVAVGGSPLEPLILHLVYISTLAVDLSRHSDKL